MFSNLKCFNVLKRRLQSIKSMKLFFFKWNKKYNFISQFGLFVIVIVSLYFTIHTFLKSQKSETNLQLWEKKSQLLFYLFILFFGQKKTESWDVNSVFISRFRLFSLYCTFLTSDYFSHNSDIKLNLKKWFYIHRKHIKYISTLMFQITCENKMSKYGWNNVPSSFSVIDILI